MLCQQDVIVMYMGESRVARGMRYLLCTRQ